jgi:replication factor C subunit 2/4
LIFTAEGDMRQAINNLQATATGFGEIRREYVFKVCDVPDIDKLRKVIDDCIAGDFNTVKLFYLFFDLKGQKNVYSLWEEGYTAYDIVNNMSKLIQNSNTLDKPLQYDLLSAVAILKMRVLEGLPTFLQISSFLATISDLGAKYKPVKK